MNDASAACVGVEKKNKTIGYERKLETLYSLFLIWTVLKIILNFNLRSEY